MFAKVIGYIVAWILILTILVGGGVSAVFSFQLIINHQDYSDFEVMVAAFIAASLSYMLVTLAQSNARLKKASRDETEN